MAGVSVFGLMMMNQTRLIPSLNHFLQVSTAPTSCSASCSRAVRSHGSARGGWHGGRRIRSTGAPVARDHVARGGRQRQPVPRLVPDALATLRDAAGTSRRRLRLARGGRHDQRDRTDRAGADRRDARRSSPGHYCPLFYFLCDRRPAIPFSEPSYYDHETRYQEEVIAATERSRPGIFLYYRGEAATYTMPVDAPLFYAYLVEHSPAVRRRSAATTSWSACADQRCGRK